MNHDLEIKEYFPVKASSFIDNPLSGGDTPEITLVSVTNPLLNGAPISPYSDYWVSSLKGRSIGPHNGCFQ